MDASFVDHGYVVSRKTNSIGPLELCIVERGAFKKILDQFIGNGAALSQFKTPRCTSNQVLLRILNVVTQPSGSSHNPRIPYGGKPPNAGPMGVSSTRIQSTYLISHPCHIPQEPEAGNSSQIT
ncbi:hypothetical protein FXO37_13363 [Capsicum annuum]|nr:hypothetical protein FXO37_13363 [Capsicum annuum]